MHFLPDFPLQLNTVFLFGLTLLLGLLGGELAKKTRIFPKITGYLAVGFLVGPHALHFASNELLTHTRVLVDVALGILLFDLGRHLNIQWIRSDRSLILISLGESCLTFFLTLILFRTFHFSWLYSLIAGTIAIATSPAVILMVIDDLAAKGPVTRRTLLLTSLNNLFALLLFTILFPMTQKGSAFFITVNTLYVLFVSIVLGITIYFIALNIGKFIGKNKEAQNILFVSCIMFAIGFASALHLSSMLTLFIFGAMVRNWDGKRSLIEINFGGLRKLFIIILFVITGAHIQLNGFLEILGLVGAFLALRIMGKFFGVWLFAKSNRLTIKQSCALSLTLIPMSGLAVGMSNIILNFDPVHGEQLMLIVTALIAVLNIIGPLVAQFAFVQTNEAAYFSKELI